MLSDQYLLLLGESAQQGREDSGTQSAFAASSRSSDVGVGAVTGADGLQDAPGLVRL